MSAPRRAPAVLATVASTVLLLGGLSACGSDPIPAPSKTKDVARSSGVKVPGTNVGGGSYQRCAEVWKTGRTLPKSYNGCADVSNNTIAFPGGQDCGDGRTLLTFQQRYWAYTGGVIHEVTDGFGSDPAYGQALTSCTRG